MSCVEGIGSESLTATAGFDSGVGGEPYSVTIRFSGHRVGVRGKPGPGDSFVHLETVRDVLPGSGPIAITIRVDGVNSGEWAVTVVVHRQDGRRRLVSPAPASRRGVIPVGSTARVRSGLAPLAQVPGTVRGGWATLVGLGVVVGISIQSSILAREQVAVGTTIAVSAIAAITGLVGAKAWFLALHRASWRGLVTAGMCIQGFLSGAAVALVIVLAVIHIPVAAFLDATAPALFLGMAVGRAGCLLAGCCAGRPVTTRWSLWSSDRRVGARRIPIQLIESVVCVLIGLIALGLVMTHRDSVSGVITVGALAAYTLARQFLLPFRAERRRTSLGRVLTIAVASLVLLPDLALIALTNG